MTETFFIGDTHFGHKAIIEYSKDSRLTDSREAFKSIEEHDEALVERWNKVVSPKDKVYHLGDFAFGKRNIVFAGRLNGDKRLVMGNHDLYGADEYLKYFTKLGGAMPVENLILTHIPVHQSQIGIGNRYYANVHGHLHSHTMTGGNWLNVSCEQVNCTPIPLDEVYNRIYALGFS